MLGGNGVPFRLSDYRIRPAPLVLQVDGVEQLFRSQVELGWRRDELERDRISWVSAIDQSDKRRGDGGGIGRGHRLQMGRRFSKTRRDEIWHKIAARYAPQFGPEVARGGGYLNGPTFLRAAQRATRHAMACTAGPQPCGRPQPARRTHTQVMSSAWAAPFSKA